MAGFGSFSLVFADPTLRGLAEQVAGQLRERGYETEVREKSEMVGPFRVRKGRLLYDQGPTTGWLVLAWQQEALRDDDFSREWLEVEAIAAENGASFSYEPPSKQ